MAGDWIPMRTDLRNDPAVIAVALALNISENHVVGCLHSLWSWANVHTENGNAAGVTEKWIDRYIGVSGFAKALQSTGWLVLDETEKGGISLPNFERWNSKCAKKRLNTAKRVETHRKRFSNATSVTEALPEKRREEKSINTPLPPSLGSVRFAEAWKNWQTHRAQLKKKMTPLAEQMALKKLEAMGEAKAVAMIEHSIANGWTGLHEPDAAKGDKRTYGQRQADAMAKTIHMAATIPEPKD